MKYSVNALHKSATVFLLRFFRVIANSKDMKYFSRDISLESAEAFKEEKDNCIRCPARGFPGKMNENIFYIFILRNPLDTLVSEYYSFGWMHAVKGTDEEQKNLLKKREEIKRGTIDEYCINSADILLKKITPLLNMDIKKMGDDHMSLTYEDMMLNFDKWSNKIFNLFHVKRLERQEIFEKFKIEFENLNELTPEEIFKGKKRHKRKATPGDYKEKLQAETIVTLQEKFKEVLQLHNKISFKK